MQTYVYDKFKEGLLKAEYDLESGTTFKAMLVSPSYTFDQTHDGVNDISSYELSGTGYTGGFGGSGRKSLSSLSVTMDSTLHAAVWSFADITWSAIDAGTIGGIVIFHQPGGASSDSDCIPLLYVLIGALTTTGVDETFVVSTSGAFRLA